MLRAARTCSTSALTPSARKDCCDTFYSFVSARDRPLEAAKGGTEKLNLTGRPIAIRGHKVAVVLERSIPRSPLRVGIGDRPEKGTAVNHSEKGVPHAQADEDAGS